ncbi:unnamed protein product [Ascophyllum nodosum]
MKLSPVASLYSAVSVLVSLCCKYRLVDGLRRSKITMSYRAVAKSGEYWRLGTSIFLFDLENPLDVYALVALFSCLVSLEKRFFKGAPSGMITVLVFMATLIMTPGFYIRELRLKEPSVMMFVAIATWATVRYCDGVLVVAGGGGRGGLVATFSALLPIAMPHLRLGALDLALLKHQGMAIAAGLACVLLIPDAEGARALLQKRQRAAKRKAGEASVAAADGGGDVVVESASSDDDIDEEEVEDDEE